MAKKAHPITAFCPHCGNTAQQKLLAEHWYEAAAYDYHTGQRDETGGPDGVYFVRICQTCGELLVYHELEGQNASKLVYPHGAELHRAVPARVRQCYQKAARVQKVEPDAYAVMLRRALEALCHDRGVNERDLHAGLAELVKKEEIPPKLAEITTVLRQLGNAGAHDGSLQVTVPMTWAMDDFFRAVVEYVYVAPSKLKEFRARLERLNKPKQNPDKG